MRSMILRVLPFLTFCVIAAAPLVAQVPDAKAQQLATDLWKASGGENWSKVSRVRFTFIVEGDGKQLAKAEHDWDVNAGTDHVKWKDKDATVNLRNPPQDELGKAAYARWVNDAYWLMAPLKILDPGVHIAYEGSKEMDGAPCETLRVSFEHVGLTPGDQYVLYINPQTKLLRSWDYIPKPETVMHGTWEKYQTFGGLQLATEHNFAGKIIRFADVDVTAK
jgi:hypothetical protein